MTTTPAFSPPATATTFTARRGALTSSRPALRIIAPSTRPVVSMQIPNPFARKPASDEPSSFSEPQPGDPGYRPATPAPTPDDASAQGGLPGARTIRRGLELLKEDFLKNAPEIVGVGRQDQTVVMKPAAGEPGYKPPSYTTVKVSNLGISPFTDDKNYVSNVGGIEAVKQAAIDSQAGKSAEQIKQEALKMVDRADSVVAPVVEKSMPSSAEGSADSLPDYLKPIPEDSTGSTWKNYAGR